MVKVRIIEIGSSARGGFGDPIGLPTRPGRSRSSGPLGSQFRYGALKLIDVE